MTVSTINKTRINTHNTYSGGSAIKYIVIHYTAGVSSKSGNALNTIKYFDSQDNASATFVIDDDNIYQYTDYTKGYRDWHCGGSKYKDTKGGAYYGKCTNMNSIGIEMCSANSTGSASGQNANVSTWSISDKVVENTVWLVQQLLKEFPNAVVIRHYDVTGKLCPGVIGWNADSGSETKWNNFKSKVAGSSATTTTSTTNYVYKVWLKFNSASAAKSALSTVQKTASEAYTLVNKSTNYIQVGAYSSTSKAIEMANKFTAYDRVIQKTLNGVIQSTYKSYSASTTTSSTSSSSSTSYKVKITADVLNVRKSASLSSDIVTTVKKDGVYTIVGETKESSTGITWGKLKSGVGYISLGYTTKV